jgi:hypothetical protein
MARVFGLALLANLVMAFNLAAFIGAKATLRLRSLRRPGRRAGLGGDVAGRDLPVRAAQPFKLWLINSGYQVLAYTVMGGVLAAWK